MAQLLSRSVSEMVGEYKGLLQIVRVIIKVVIIFIHIEFIIVKVSISEVLSVKQLVIIVITVKYTSNARVQLTKFIFIQFTSAMTTPLLFLLISILILIW